MNDRKVASVIPLRRLPPHLHEFNYQIPASLLHKCTRGSVVRIPFKQGIITGVIKSIDRGDEKIRNLKEIKSVTSITLTEWQLELAAHLSQYYHVSIAIILHSFLSPPPLRAHRTVTSNRNPLHTSASLRRVTAEIADSYVLYASYDDLFAYIAGYLVKIKQKGQTVIIVPEHDQRNLVTQLANASELQNHSFTFIPSKQQKNAFTQAWKDSETADVVIGSLSTLFMPFKNLISIIVIEAEHQQFQRAQQNPRYHLADFIFFVSKLYSSRLLLTGFSPDIRLLHEAQENNFFLKNLGSVNKNISVVDLRSERAAGNKKFLGFDVLEAVRASVNRVLLLYNRHGDARLSCCNDCGYKALCPTCDKPLIVDDALKTLLCINCGSRRDVDLVCPSCKGTDIAFKGSGIRNVIKEVKSLVPGRSTFEFSSRSTSSLVNLPHDAIVVATNKIFGTNAQKLFKMAIVINADFDLHIPNYHAAESLRHYFSKLRSFTDQLYIQTFNPEHYIFSTLDLVKDFYDAELTWRKKIGYPPYRTLIKVSVRDSDEIEFTKKISQLKSHFKSVEHFGPFERRSKSTRYASIIIRADAKEQAHLDSLLTSSYNWFQIEINPYDLKA